MFRALTGALCLLLTSSALAKGRLAVVDMSAPPDLVSLGGQMTLEVLKASQSQGYHVVPPSEVHDLLGEKPYQELQGCQGNLDCVLAHVSGLKADRLVVGSLNRDEKSYLFRVWLVDLKTEKVVASVDRTVLIAARRLMRDVSASLPGLLQGEAEQPGTLKLSSNTPGADVLLDGAAVGKTPLTLTLKAGKHDLRLEKKGYMRVDRQVTAEPGKQLIEQVDLTQKPEDGPSPLPRIMPPAGAPPRGR